MATTTLKKPTPNDWLAVLSAASKGSPDVVPKGFKTLAQIAEETGGSASRVRQRIKAAVKAGAVEEARFTVDTGSKLYPMAHYRIK